MNFSAIYFNEAQDVAKTSTLGHVPVFHKVINLVIDTQNFLLMLLISKRKGYCLIVTVCDGLPMLSLDLFNFCITFTWYDIFRDELFKRFTLVFLRFYSDIPTGIYPSCFAGP